MNFNKNYVRNLIYNKDQNNYKLEVKQNSYNH